MKFCDKLQKIRKEHNITQECLADKLDVSRQAVSKWESGTAYPDTEKLIQISKIFNVSLDDLINENTDMNKTNVEKKFNFKETFDIVFNFVSKVFKMFWSMKFWEKCKFLIEMILVGLALWGLAAISGNIICGLVRRIFAFLPFNILNVLINIVDTILYVAWWILGSIIFIRVLKTRYLDYYVFVTDDSVTEKTVEEPIKELKEKKDYKVVIRDPEHSSYNFFKKVGNVLLFCFKLFCIFLAFPFIMAFIFFVAALVISLVFAFSGLFFNGITIAIVGIIIFIYLVIEFMYDVIFNRKHAYLRSFILFMICLSLVGTGIGLSFISLDSFTTYNEKATFDKETSEVVKMQDNLIVLDIEDMPDDKIFIDDSLDDIKINVVAPEDTYVILRDNYTYNYEDDSVYKAVHVDAYNDGMAVMKKISKDIKQKKINLYNFQDEDDNYEVTSIYVSSSNLAKLRENYHKLYD